MDVDEARDPAILQDCGDGLGGRGKSAGRGEGGAEGSEVAGGSLERTLSVGGRMRRLADLKLAA